MGRQGIRKLAVAGAVAVGALASAGAAGATTWEGDCEIQGVSTFGDPIGGLPAGRTYTDSGTGTCTGTLNGAPEVDAPIVLAAEGEGLAGCLFGHSTMWGTITFTRGTPATEDDVSSSYIGEASGSVGQFVSRTRGTNGGSGIAYVQAGGANQATFEACRDSTLTSVSWSAITTTFTPFEG